MKFLGKDETHRVLPLNPNQEPRKEEPETKSSAKDDKSSKDKRYTTQRRFSVLEGRTKKSTNSSFKKGKRRHTPTQHAIVLCNMKSSRRRNENRTTKALSLEEKSFRSAQTPAQSAAAADATIVSPKYLTEKNTCQ